MTDHIYGDEEDFGLGLKKRLDELDLLANGIYDATRERILQTLWETRTYILVAYQPNHVDTCRGCVMSRADSEHYTHIFHSMDELAKQIAQYKEADRTRGHEYAAWELTLFCDGAEISQWSDHFEHIQALVNQEHEAIQERKEQEESDRKHREAVALNEKLAEEAKQKRIADQQKLRDLIGQYGIPEDIKTNS